MDQPGAYMCDCLPAYTGEHCETEVNECGSNPCKNGGTCMDQPGAYMCDCLPAYVGEHCETEINECLSNPCILENGGTCVDQISAYTCVCPCDYEGLQCDKDTDECNTTKQGCQHDCQQQCINNIGSFSCACDEGYALKVDRKSCTNIPCEREQSDCKSFAECVDDMFKCGSESYIKEFFDGFCSLTGKVDRPASLWINNVTNCLSSKLRSFWKKSYFFGVSDPVVSDCRKLSQQMRAAQEGCFKLFLCDTSFTEDDANSIVEDAFKQSETNRAQLDRITRRLF
jgi:hypothetical protein